MRHAGGRGAYINVGSQCPFLEAGMRRLPTSAAPKHAPDQRSGEMRVPKHYSMSRASRHKPSIRNCLFVYWVPWIWYGYKPRRTCRIVDAIPSCCIMRLMGEDYYAAPVGRAAFNRAVSVMIDLAGTSVPKQAAA